MWGGILRGAGFCTEGQTSHNYSDKRICRKWRRESVKEPRKKKRKGLQRDGGGGRNDQEKGRGKGQKREGPGVLSIGRRTAMRRQLQERARVLKES